MKQHLAVATRLVIGGFAAALVYTGETLLESVRVFVATDEEIDADDDDTEEDAAAVEVATMLTGLDAETWVNRLSGDHHDPDEYADGSGPCGHSDCRWCWVHATGAEG